MKGLNAAIKFHGHLGPYLVLGLLAGEAGLRKLKCGKYFRLEVKVFGAHKKPKSCLIDGLQLSTGATFGKGNIKKYNGKIIKILIRNLKKNRKLEIKLQKHLVEGLNNLRNDGESEAFARKILRRKPDGAFRFRYL